MQTVFGPRRLDRIRVLVPCFRPLGLLGASGGKAFSQDHPKGYFNWEFVTTWNVFLRLWGAPRPPIGAHSLIFFRVFCEVRKLIDLGKLWAGAGGRGRGLPEPSDSEILTKDSTRPAPPEGDAANI